MGLNVPLVGLYVREDVDMKCNIMLTNFVKKTFKKSHAELVARLSFKAQLLEAAAANNHLAPQTTSPPLGYADSVHSSVGSPGFPPQNMSMMPELQTTPHNGAGQVQQNQYQPYDPRMSVQGSFHRQQSMQGSYHQQQPMSQFAPSELSNAETSTSSTKEDTKKTSGSPPTLSPAVELP